ncbi:MAG: hypothetical protein J6Y20_04605 [Lachnospiraceae bacterium]|nr:hypothetical protein [Kiritimatiellia bacterium]MBP5461386.1 hypothetical protein [Lachnospiraceae bacterium]
MAENQGVAAALQLDDKILENLATAQTGIEKMRDAASALATNFESVAKSAGSLVANLKGSGVSVKEILDTDGTIKELAVVSDAAEKVGAKGAASLAKVDKALEKNRKKIEKTKQAIAQKQMKLTDALGLDESSTASINKKITSIKSSLESLRTGSGSIINANAISNAEKDLTRLNNKLTVSRSSLALTQHSAGMLGGVLRQVFSTVLISRFVSNVVKIRGEFEMSERSLAVIINDAVQAREIFGEIQKIAVKSPFQVKDLVKYTKQLAAYRVETDKLIETTKTLGDISAGVGVDMNRLILAYGQVKAATYLKGTELRQFSEAGVNMLGGLADRFSEIQKRAVSTGEVLQMVSKRMVSFADVDAVLRQQTEFGGTFYKMQEKQAETIQGRISNIKDKLDIMFNEIGKSAQGLITFILDAIDKIIENYGYLETALAAGTVFMSVVAIFNGIVKIGKALGAVVATLSLIKTEGLLATMTAGLGVGGPILAGVLAIGAAIAVIVMHATRLRRELTKMAEETQEENTKMLTSFEHLTGVIQDQTKSSKARNDAFEELKRQFGNVLPLENENIDTIKQGTEKYKEYAAAIRESNYELLREKQLLAIRDARNRDTTKELKNIQSALTQTVYMSENDELNFLVDKYKMLPQIYNDVQQEIFDGSIKSAEEASEQIIARLEEAYGKERGLVRSILGDNWIDNVFTRRIKRAFNAQGLMADINKELLGDVSFGAVGSMLRDQMKDAFGSLYKGDDPELKLQAQEQGEAFIKAFTDGIENSKDAKGNPLFNETQQVNLKNEMNRLAKDLMSPMQKALTNLYADINKKYPNLTSKIGIGDMLLKENEKTEDAVKRLKASKKMYDDIVATWKDIDAAREQGLVSPLVEPTMSKEEASAQAQAINALVEGLGKLFKLAADKSAIAAQKKALRDFLTSLKNAAKEMDKLDDKGDDLFNKRLRLLAKNAGISLPVDFDPKTANFEDYAKKYLSKLSEEDRIQVQLEWNKEETQNRVKELSNEIQDAWDRYSNAKRMEEFGLTPFDGKKSEEILEELAAKEEQLRKNGAADEIELANQISKKRLEIVRTEQEKVAKIMYDAAKKALDKEQQAYQDMLENIAKIRNTEGFTPEQKEKGVADQVARSMKEIAAAQWDAYKSSEAYALTFGDLSHLSDDLLRSLKENLRIWLTMPEGSLQPTEIQAIMKRMREIDQIAGNNKVKTFFGAIVTGFKEIAKAKEIMETIPELSDAVARSQKGLFDAIQELNDARAADALYHTADTAERLELAMEEVDFWQMKLTGDTAKLNDAQEESNRLFSASTERMRVIEDGYNAIANEITGVIDLVMGMADAFGLTISDEAAAGIEGFQKGFQLIGSAISLAASAMMMLDIAAKAAETSASALLATLTPIIGPVLVALLAVGAAIAALQMKDASLQKQIEAHKKNVELLEKSYEKLEKAMDKALDVDKARQSYAEMSANLAKQRQELEEAIAANEQRKQNKDVREETEDLRDQLSELDEKVEESRNKWLEMLGAVTDYQSLARDWASDWLDAFKETGSGLDALKDKFDDLYDNLVVGQLWSRIMGPRVEALEKLVGDAIGDGELTESEAAAIRAFKSTFAQANEDLQKLAESLGIKSGSIKGDTLQRGVETVTETTAQAIDSILNATRFDVSDTNARVANIEAAITGEGDNTIMAQLRSQTRYLSDIARIAEAVFFPGGHYKGGGGIKVFAEVK